MRHATLDPIPSVIGYEPRQGIDQAWLIAAENREYERSLIHDRLLEHDATAMSREYSKQNGHRLPKQPMPVDQNQVISAEAYWAAPAGNCWAPPIACICCAFTPTPIAR